MFFDSTNSNVVKPAVARWAGAKSSASIRRTATVPYFFIHGCRYMFVVTTVSAHYAHRQTFGVALRAPDGRAAVVATSASSRPSI